jgi:L-malate glycosyltransferase
MKVLHVLYSGLGGHGNVFFSMVSADDNKALEYEALFNGVEEVREEYKERCSNYQLTWNFVKKKPGLDIGYYIKLYRQIKKAAPDVIFLHGGAAVIPARLAKLTGGTIKKIIVRETQANHLKSTIDWVYLATAMLLADEMVYLSAAYKQQVQAKLKWLYKEKRSHVIPNGIDLNTFTPTPVRQNPTAIVLGMQSRLISIKDHITLLSAFALLLQKQLPLPVKLIIAGDGEYKTTLEAHASALNITQQVSFTGMLEEKELVNFLQQTDIYIHASLGETMSTAIMQAMACGKPIIASDVMGINNMIENNITGILVPPQNAAAMAAALWQLINNPAIANQLAGNAFNFAAANYSNKKMLASYKEIFTN